MDFCFVQPDVGVVVDFCFAGLSLLRRRTLPARAPQTTKDIYGVCDRIIYRQCYTTHHRPTLKPVNLQFVIRQRIIFA